MAKRFWSFLDYIETRVGSRGNFLRLRVRFHNVSIAFAGQIRGTAKPLIPRALIEVIPGPTGQEPCDSLLGLAYYFESVDAGVVLDGDKGNHESAGGVGFEPMKSPAQGTT